MSSYTKVPDHDLAEDLEVSTPPQQRAMVDPRSGDTVYGFSVGLYPTDYSNLPDRSDEAPKGQ